MSPGFGFDWIRAARRRVFSLPTELHGPIFALVAFDDFGVENYPVRAGKVANLSAIGGEFNLEHFGLRGVHIDIPDGLEFGFGVGVPDLQGDTVLLGLILDFLDCLAEALQPGNFGLAVETAVRSFSQDKVVEVSAIRVAASDAVICMQVFRGRSQANDLLVYQTGQHDRGVPEPGTAYHVLRGFLNSCHIVSLVA